jgi:hypothetical protein
MKHYDIGKFTIKDLEHETLITAENAPWMSCKIYRSSKPNESNADEIERHKGFMQAEYSKIMNERRFHAAVASINGTRFNPENNSMPPVMAAKRAFEDADAFMEEWLKKE